MKTAKQIANEALMAEKQRLGQQVRHEVHDLWLQTKMQREQQARASSTLEVRLEQKEKIQVDEDNNAFNVTGPECRGKG